MVLHKKIGEDALPQLQKALRAECKKSGLAPFKNPTVIKFVLDEELPKTATHKYIRSNLAEKLGIKAQDVGAAPRLGPPRVSSALAGVRFFLACQVMFNHVGTHKPGGFGTVSNVVLRTAFHVPSFYALAGFGLAQTMGPAPKSKLAFIAARLSPMYPMY